MIGERIRALRDAKRLSQADLGEACGVSGQAVWNWETGANRGPSRDVLPKLAKALGVTIDALLREDSAPEQAPPSGDQPPPTTPVEGEPQPKGEVA